MSSQPKLSKADYVARARFRHQLRLFERFTQEACDEQDITLTQYLLLLQVKGRPDRDWALVRELSDCLVLRHNTTVELVSRCEAAQLVRREQDPDDLRKVRVMLTPRGARIVEKIARHHLEVFERLLAHMRTVLEG